MIRQMNKLSAIPKNSEHKTYDCCYQQLYLWLELYRELIGSKNPTAIEITRLASMFPYTVTVKYYREVGKHFVSPQVLELLHLIYKKIQCVDGVGFYGVCGHGPQCGPKILIDFLECCLDKHLNMYDYKSYIGLSLFLDDTLPMQVIFEEANNFPVAS